MRAQIARMYRALTAPTIIAAADVDSQKISCSRPDATAAVVARHVARHVARYRSAVVEPLESRQLLAATYYVSPLGSDAAAGTSITTPWKSIDRVNNATLKPGDKVLFQGGKSFGGSLYLGSREGGTATAQIAFGSYGTGRATINSGDKPGIDVSQSAGIGIANLNFVGNGMRNNASPGIYFHVDFLDRDVSNVTIDNVEVSGYGREGIRFKVVGAGSSISNVTISNVKAHDNLWAGVKMTGSAHNSNKNWIIDHVQAYNNVGDRSASGVTGNGIYIADVDGARINRCVAYNNGADGAAPVGIWAAGSNRVTIQYCESYDNKTGTSTDGGGFDFDWDVTNSVMQYNYSHGNAGPGYILAAGPTVNDNNTIRFNVSENDGRKNGKAGMQLWGNVTNAAIYNNAVFTSWAQHNNTAAFYAHDSASNGKTPKNVQVRNNIFYTTGGAKLVSVSSGVARANGIVFAGNCYYTTGGTYKFQWGTTTTKTADGKTVTNGIIYGGLSAWRTAAGAEKLDGRLTGYQGDPKLAAAGAGGTIGNADLLRNLAAYKLQAGSPLINRGVAQPTFLASVPTDFFGDALPKGGSYDIGIDEVA
ncbi:MAG TPA: right-handed parallel beta-helix repeat-containing protein [Tepidisphaeraceae bacterium]|nr:right-handed parallel beta-helix repeat-containing protein [Tepidisphaeraceae bacterium]